MKLTSRSKSHAPYSLAKWSASHHAQQLNPSARWRQQGKIGWIVLWLLGIPIPILFGLFLLRGCT